MIRTHMDKRTGVNTNYRDDFSTRTFDHLLGRLVAIGRAKQRAMWRARNG